ncbi:MAG: bacillithiol biosynthesis cysteine-adding enzyme BshC [Daejeonella sp.]
MKATYLNYSETNSFSPAIIRYLASDPALDPFRSFNPDIEGFRKILHVKKNHSNRSVLTRVLHEQYSQVSEPGSLVLENIALLNQQSTFTVTTGHQLNIFTGPLYFIFKIVSTINLARELKVNFPEKNFVPVYWMATEDHDFAEINHTYIAGKKVTWNREAAGATGRLETRSIEQALKEYTGTLGVSHHAEELKKIIQSAYTGNSNLTAATRALVNSLFEEYGLVILDADHPGLKREFCAIIRDDIMNQNSFKHITSTNKKLEELGIETQVNPREINFFYLKDGIRERIVFEGKAYQILNTQIKFSPEELEKEINQYPERFSPNVIMRPLYQEVVLPNIAYIGGAAEIIYWLQLKDNFDFYEIDFPILILRNSALFTSDSLESKLSRLNLSFKDIFKGAEEIKKEWIVNHSDHILNLNDEWKELSCIFEKIKLRTHKIDSTLSASTEAVKARLHKAIKTLEGKLIKAEKRNFSDALSQIDSIKAKLFPRGGLQERTENFGLFYVKHGRQFIKTLVENFKPLDQRFTILEDEHS